MMTTAKMREKARLYETRLDWEKAALCWDATADLYPQPCPTPGALAVADIGAMRRRAQSCRTQTTTETL